MLSQPWLCGTCTPCAHAHAEVQYPRRLVVQQRALGRVHGGAGRAYACVALEDRRNGWELHIFARSLTFTPQALREECPDSQFTEWLHALPGPGTPSLPEPFRFRARTNYQGT